MKTRPNVLARNLHLASQLADENGVLPNPNRLIRMGYEGLYRYILRHSEKFVDFEYREAVETRGDTTFNIKIRSKHLFSARKLIQEYGVLPPVKWLGDHGFTKLASYMRIYPAVFSSMTNGKCIMEHAAASQSSAHHRKGRKRIRNR